MTPKKLAHLQTILDEFHSAYKQKYHRGAMEHSGNLWEKDPLWLLNEAIAESLDGFGYLTTLKHLLLDVLKENQRLREEIKRLKK